MECTRVVTSTTAKQRRTTRGERRARTKRRKMHEASEAVLGLEDMRNAAESAKAVADKAETALKVFKGDAVWRQRAREGKACRQDTWSVRRHMSASLSAVAIEVVLLIRACISSSLIRELVTHAKKTATEALQHDYDILSGRFEPKSPSHKPSKKEAVEMGVRQQSRGNVRGQGVTRPHPIPPPPTQKQEST